MYHLQPSLVASRADHDEMLEFTARNDIHPIVQVFKHEGASTVQQIFDNIHQNKVRYRAVLEY
jgi:D-arabinose 1-dehydrogenase-like Zn-dependent alcohol dehydrogenase